MQHVSGESVTPTAFDVSRQNIVRGDSFATDMDQMISLRRQYQVACCCGDSDADISSGGDVMNFKTVTKNFAVGLEV